MFTPTIKSNVLHETKQNSDDTCHKISE